jgi:hypothetical protein
MHPARSVRRLDIKALHHDQVYQSFSLLGSRASSSCAVLEGQDTVVGGPV